MENVTQGRRVAVWNLSTEY